MSTPDVGAAIMHARSAKRLIEEARQLRDHGVASQTEIDNVIDAAELQIESCLQCLPRDEGQQLRIRRRRRTGS